MAEQLWEGISCTDKARVGEKRDVGRNDVDRNDEGPSGLKCSGKKTAHDKSVGCGEECVASELDPRKRGSAFVRRSGAPDGTC